MIVTVGAPSRGPLGEAIREYERRAARYFRLRVEEVSPARGAAERAGGRRQEGQELLRRVPEGLEVWALTREGRGLRSEELAAYLEELGTYGLPGAAFLVGGPGGLPRGVLEAASRRLSLSSFTLPHDLARLVLAEQLYRAGTILRGEPYHRG